MFDAAGIGVLPGVTQDSRGVVISNNRFGGDKSGAFIYLDSTQTAGVALEGKLLRSGHGGEQRQDGRWPHGLVGRGSRVGKVSDVRYRQRPGVHIAPRMREQLSACLAPIRFTRIGRLGVRTIPGRSSNP